MEDFSTHSTFSNGCVLTLGKFESLHLGHRVLIKKTVERAKELGLPAVVLTFNPHPFAVLSDKPYSPLYTQEEVALILSGLGVDYLLLKKFDCQFAQTSAAEFEKFLFDEIKAREIFVGAGYLYGHGRAGTTTALTKAAVERDCFTHVIPHEAAAGEENISTSRIRALLCESFSENSDNLEKANKLLGQPFFIAGKCESGKKLGRTIGFPTINLYPQADKFLPENGVYKTNCIIEGISYPAITNIGTNPTVESSPKRKVETHVLNNPNFGELYGSEIIIELLSFIRSEKKFTNVTEMVQQIKKDIAKRSCL